MAKKPIDPRFYDDQDQFFADAAAEGVLYQSTPEAKPKSESDLIAFGQSKFEGVTDAELDAVMNAMDAMDAASFDKPEPQSMPGVPGNDDFSATAAPAVAGLPPEEARRRRIRGMIMDPRPASERPEYRGPSWWESTARPGESMEVAEDIGTAFVNFFVDTVPGAATATVGAADAVIGNYGSRFIEWLMTPDLSELEEKLGEDVVQQIRDAALRGAGYNPNVNLAVQMGQKEIASGSAPELYNAPDGMAAQVGQMVAQASLIVMPAIIGTMVGGPAGTAIGAGLGMAGTATMVTVATGTAISSYYEFCEETGTEYDPAMAAGLGILSGGAELLFNKLRIPIRGGKFAISFGQRGVERSIRSAAAEAFLAGLRANDAKLAAKMFKASAGAALSEGAEEGVTEAFQTAIQAFYRGFGEEGPFEGVTLEEILNNAAFGAVFGSLIGGGATYVGVSGTTSQMYGSGLRTRADASLFTPGEGIRIHRMLTSLGVDSATADSAIAEMKNADVRRTRNDSANVKGSAKAEEAGASGVTSGGSAEFAEIDDSDILKVATGDTRDTEMTPEQATSEAAARGILPTDEQKGEILGQEAAPGGTAEGDPTSPALMGRAQLHAIARRLYEAAPALARRLRDKGSLTVSDLALFLPGDEQYLSGFVRKALKGRIDAVVREAAAATAEKSAMDASIEAMEEALEANAFEGVPLTDSQRSEITAELARMKAVRDGEAAPAANPTPESSGSTEPGTADPAAPQRVVRDGDEEYDLDAMNLSVLEEMVIKFGLGDPSLMSNDEIRQAVFDHFSVEGQTRDDADELEAAERATIEGEMEEAEAELLALTADPEAALTAEDEEQIDALQATIEDLEGRLAELDRLAAIRDRDKAADATASAEALIASKIAGEGEAAEPLTLTEAYETLDAIASDGDAAPVTGETEQEEELRLDPEPAAEQETQDPTDRLLERLSSQATRRAREVSGDETATVVIRRATNKDIGSVAAKALRAVRQIVSRGRKIVPIVVEGSHASTYSGRGFVYRKLPDTIFVAVTKNESKRLKDSVGNRIKNGRARNLLRSQTENSLFLSYVQTVLHENVHLDDKPGPRRSRALVAVDQIIASLNPDQQRAALAMYQGERAAREFSENRIARELRAEMLTEARTLRMIGINQILDANPAIGDEVINRLKYITANFRGGQKFRQALIQDIIDVLNENTQSNGNTARRKYANEMESEVVEEQARQPNDDIRSIADAYAKANGIEYDERASREGVVSVDVERAKAIADLFEESSNQTSNEELLASYAALAEETISQYEALKAAGYEMIPWGSPGDPYQNSAEMMEDVRENKRIYYYKTLNEDELSFGSDPAQVEEMMRRNPMLREAGGVINDSAGRPYRQTVNDLFRAVHDIFGHAKEGQQFGPRGEENAWRQHVRMFSPRARIAMSSETRGQNSWVNYGRHLRRDDGTMPAAGDPDFIHPKDRPFADQKIVRLPSWATAENGLDVEAWPGASTVDGVEYQGRGHINDRTSLNSITTNDLRDSIDPLLRSGMRELPYVENDEPTLSSGRLASDRALRGVHNKYPVGTFTLDDMKAVRDKSVSILRAIFDGAPEMAASKFRSARNQILEFNSNEDFPVIDPAVMNDTFADETLRDNHRFWYEASGRAMSDRIIYTGKMTAGRLADYWSATSPQTNVLDNAKRGLAIAVDEEQRGTSRVGIPTPSLTRDAAGGRYESSRSNSYKASSFGDTMAMFAGSSRGVPMTTNDIWVSYYFGFRILDPKTGRYGGDNSVYSDPYAYLYTSIYMSVLAEEINRRVEASPQYAAAKARLNDGNGTLADESLVTPWTPWQVQAYPWSHLSDSGTFDDAIDSIGDLLASANHPSVSTVNGEHVIDLEKAVADSEFATILIPSAIPREDMVVPLEFGGADIGKGTERSARREIDAILSDPEKQKGRTKKSIERLRTARGMIYKEIGSVLRLIGGSGAPSDHPGYATAASFADWLVGVKDSVALAKGNQFVHNLLAALMPTPSNFKELQAKHREIAREMDKARKAKREPDEQLIASIQEEIAALQKKRTRTLTTVGVPTGPTAGAMQVIETPYLGAKSFSLGVTGLDKAGRGFGGYYGGVFSPNVPVSLFGLTAKGRQKFAAIIGAALGEQAVAGSRWYAGEKTDEGHGRCVVFHAVGKSLTHDDIADLKRRIDADTRENGMWMSMQLNTIGTDVIVGNPDIDEKDFDEIFQANGFDRATEGHFEGIYVDADAGRRGPNYGIKRILSDFVRQDYAAGSQWRKNLSDSQREAVAKVEALDSGRDVLRGLLAGSAESQREVRDLGSSDRRALAAALRQSQSFRVHFSYGALRREADAARERLNALVAPGGEVSRILEEEDIDYQIRVSLPTTKEHAEFFRDSKIRDDDGKLIPVVHGTVWYDHETYQTFQVSQPFYRFDTNARGWYGRGVYFTEDTRTAAQYSTPVKGLLDGPPIPRTYVCYLNIKNPAVLDATNIPRPPGKRFRIVTEQVFEEFFQQNHPELLAEFKAERDRRAEKSSLAGYGSEARIAGDVATDMLKDLGYDGIVAKDVGQHRGETYYVAFDAEQIKSVFNEYPGSNPFVDEQRRVDVNSDEFKEWFGDSDEMRDEAGEPRVVYHGTKDLRNAGARTDWDVSQIPPTEEDFTVFRTETARMLGVGAYFTSSPMVADIYSGSERKLKASRILPVYLRMENPFILDDTMSRRAIVRELSRRHPEIDAELQASENDAEADVQQKGEQLNEIMRRLGYDGIIIRPRLYEGDSRLLPESAETYVVFDPNQIKSALTTSDTGPSLSREEIDEQRRDPDAGPVQNLAALVESRRNRLESRVEQFRGMLNRDGLPAATVVVKRDDEGVPVLITINDTDPVGEEPVAFMHFDPSVGDADSWYADLYDAAMSIQDRVSMWDGAVHRMDMDSKFLTEDDELSLVEYMARPANIDVESPMRSLTEIRESMAESGVRFGLNARSLGRWVASRINQSFGNEWQVLEAVVSGIENEIGRRLPAKYDPMRAIRLRSGVEAETLTQFSTRTKRRIEEAMLREKVTSEEVGRYLAAKHALERNDRIRRINVGRKDLKESDRLKLNCGISDETAARLLEEHEASENAAAIEQIADMFREITHETALAAKHAGLISNEDFDRITTAYKFYIPMNVTGSNQTDFKSAVTDRADDVLARLRSKRGGQYMGSTLDADTGRRSKLKYTLGRTESEETVRAIIRGATGAILVDRMATEREAITNRIANRLLRLAVKYPNSILKLAGSGELTERFMDTAADLVKVRAKDPESDKTDNAMIPVRLEETMDIDGVVYERGEIVYLVVTDPTLSSKLQKGDPGQVDGVVKALTIMAKIPRAFTSLIRLTSTQFLTPDFTFTQPLLDFQTAIIEAVQDGRVTAKTVAMKGPACLKTIFLTEGRRAMMPTAEAEAESPALGPYAEYYDEFRRIGGKQSWFKIQNVDAMAKAMESINGSGAKDALKRHGKLAKRFLFDSYNILNDVGDNMWRLSYYITLRENGVDAETAAVAARNLTVDFSRKGDASAFISGMWSFFNATVQGNIRTKKQLFTGKKGLAAFTGIASLGLLSRLLMWAMGGYEDKDKNGVADFLEQVPEYKQRRNILIPYGINDDGTLKIFTIPLNYGLEIPYLMGAGMVDVGMGIKSVGEVGLEVGANIATAFNPVAGTPLDSMHGMLRSVAPDILDPVIDIAMNRNFTGRRIYYGDNPIGGDNPTVRSEIGSARETYGIDWNQTAVAINHAFGGDEAYRSSMVTDMQPEAWQYLFGTLAGSTGRTLERIGAFSLGMYNYIHYDDPMPSTSTIPVVRRFVLDVNENFYSTNYYIIRDRVNNEQDRIEVYNKRGKREKARSLAETLDGSPRMASVVKNAESQNRKIRKAIRELDDRIRNMDRGRERDLLIGRRQKFLDRQKELMRRVITAYTESGGRL